MLLPEGYCIDLDFQFEYLNIDYQNFIIVNCRVICSFLLPKPSIIGWCNIKLAFVACNFSFNKSKCILRQLKVTKVQPCCGYSQILNGSRQDGGLGQQQQLEVGVEAVAGRESESEQVTQQQSIAELGLCQLRHLALSHYFAYPSPAPFVLVAPCSAPNCCCNRSVQAVAASTFRGHNSPFIRLHIHSFGHSFPLLHTDSVFLLLQQGKTGIIGISPNTECLWVCVTPCTLCNFQFTFPFFSLVCLTQLKRYKFSSAEFCSFSLSDCLSASSYVLYSLRRMFNFRVVAKQNHVLYCCIL